MAEIRSVKSTKSERKCLQLPDLLGILAEADKEGTAPKPNVAKLKAKISVLNHWLNMACRFGTLLAVRDCFPLFFLDLAT